MPFFSYVMDSLYFNKQFYGIFNSLQSFIRLHEPVKVENARARTMGICVQNMPKTWYFSIDHNSSECLDTPIFYCIFWKSNTRRFESMSHSYRSDIMTSSKCHLNSKKWFFFYFWKILTVVLAPEEICFSSFTRISIYCSRLTSLLVMWTLFFDLNSVFLC